MYCQLTEVDEKVRIKEKGHLTSISCNHQYYGRQEGYYHSSNGPAVGSGHMTSVTMVI